jgi:hypothetical protein
LAGAGTHSNGLRVLGHVEIAADNGEVDLAVRQRLGAGGRAVGLHRLQADIGTMLRKGLRQRLHDLDVIAVGRTDRDSERHRPNREIIAGDQRADDGEHAGERHQKQAARRRTRRWRRRGAVYEFLSHRPCKQWFDAQIRQPAGTHTVIS